MMKLPYSILIILLALALSACHSKENKKHDKVITVYPRSHVTHLYYSGTIKPIAENLVISPAAGVISKINFHYGDFVKKGDILFAIHSPEMEREFRETITNYLRVKQAYLTSKKSMAGTLMLYKEKIISEQEYENEKGQFQNTLLSYIESSTKLQQFLAYLPSVQQNYLNNDDIDLKKAVAVLQQKMDDLCVIAPASGLILFPEEKANDQKPIQLGLDVKKNDVLASIGDVTGLSITANVTENDINSIKPGSQVLLTFQSNLEVELRGTIVSVAKQAKSTENTGFSTFPVVINVPKLSAKQAEKIKIGMNVKLDILIEEPATLRIPIKAIITKNHSYYVKMLNRDNKLFTREIVPGTTDQESVTILKGLNKGDRVILQD